MTRNEIRQGVQTKINRSMFYTLQVIMKANSLNWAIAVKGQNKSELCPHINIRKASLLRQLPYYVRHGLHHLKEGLARHFLEGTIYAANGGGVAENLTMKAIRYLPKIVQIKPIILNTNQRIQLYL